MVVLAWAWGHHGGLWDLICRSPALNSRYIHKSWEPTCLQKSPGLCCAAERVSMFVGLKVVWGLWYISRGTVVAWSHCFLASVQEMEGGAVFCLSVFKRHVWAFPYPLWREDRESHCVVWNHWLHRKLECLEFLGFRFLALIILKNSACRAGLGSFLQTGITMGNEEAERRNETQLLNLTISSWKMTKKQPIWWSKKYENELNYLFNYVKWSAFI